MRHLLLHNARIAGFLGLELSLQLWMQPADRSAARLYTQQGVTQPSKGVRLLCSPAALTPSSPAGMEAKADVAQHSTTLMAGAFAAQVAARLLVLTHFSAR